MKIYLILFLILFFAYLQSKEKRIIGRLKMNIKRNGDISCTQSSFSLDLLKTEEDAQNFIRKQEEFCVIFQFKKLKIINHS
jgi:hypothetical protein